MLTKITQDMLEIESLGTPALDSPIGVMVLPDSVRIDDRILVEPSLSRCSRAIEEKALPPAFELAGPRQKIYFNPVRTRAAIVTCGGLCPGLNDVIRAVVMELWHHYGVRNIAGVRYGYQGMGAKATDNFVELNPDFVEQIHDQGGTVLGSSRGTPPVSEIVDTLEQNNMNILFTIGGDGTMRGLLEIREEVKKRGLKIALVGIPKTIDNDIPFVKRSFGFETAVEVAAHVLRSAHVEAKGAKNGVGIVKLMGRSSGHIAAHAAISSGEANYCLVPEIPFSLEGEGGLLELLEKRMASGKAHCLLVVAEGAGQHYFNTSGSEKDASGNPKMGDIGVFLKDRIGAHFKSKNLPINFRYIDPSYLVRSAPANSADSLFCAQLAQNAVHAAMAGKTGLLIGYWHGRMTHVPVKMLSGHRQDINPHGELWFNVLGTTGQPMTIGSAEAAK